MISVGIQSFNRQWLAALGRAENDYSLAIELLNDIETAFGHGATQVST